ncbi:MAG TPA: hypothetical protein VHJ77_00755 [Vicinamibacterales bacterium]|nr:hypothetical protein [Vicinamibacterales bacterium]
MKDDLEHVFGSRLLSLIGYADGRRMAVVASLTPDDLATLVPLAGRWRAAGIGAPLLMTRHELERTLDIFPIEYAQIFATRELLAGVDPFAGLSISTAHLRRACERQVKSHLIHLREGFLESGGRPSALTDLVAGSAAAFRALLHAASWLTDKAGDARPRLDDDQSLTRFAESELGMRGAVVRDVLGSDRGRPVEAQALMPAYLTEMERLWSLVDDWQH